MQKEESVIFMLETNVLDSLLASCLRSGQKRALIILMASNSHVFFFKTLGVNL